MKITKGRILKILLKENQTRKCIKNKVSKTHTHTNRRRKHFNLRNFTIKN